MREGQKIQPMARPAGARPLLSFPHSFFQHNASPRIQQFFPTTILSFPIPIFLFTPHSPFDLPPSTFHFSLFPIHHLLLPIYCFTIPYSPLLTLNSPLAPPFSPIKYILALFPFPSQNVLLYGMIFFR